MGSEVLLAPDPRLLPGLFQMMPCSPGLGSTAWTSLLKPSSPVLKQKHQRDLLEVVSGDKRKILSNQCSCWREEGESSAVYTGTDRCAVSPPSLKNQGTPSFLRSVIHSWKPTQCLKEALPQPQTESTHVLKSMRGEENMQSHALSSQVSSVCCFTEVFICQQQYSVCCLKDPVSSWSEQANRIWYFSLLCLLWLVMRNRSPPR